MDPMGMLAVSSVANALKPAPAYSGSSGTQTATVDNSGWMVNFGSGSQESARAQTPMPLGASTNSINAWMPYILLGLGGIVVWKLATRKSSR